MRRYYAEDVMSRHAPELLLFKRNRHKWWRLRKKKALVAGAGGLGHFVVAELLGTGIGEIHVVDPDSVEVHNLNRQFWFTVEDVGRKKAEVIPERASGRPTRIVGVEGRVEDVDVSGYDVVIDCLDTWEKKMALLKRCREENVPFVLLSVGEGRGIVSVPRKEIPYNIRPFCIVSTPEIAVATGIGVNEVIRILQGEEPLLLDKLLVFDLNTYTFEIYEL